MATFPLSKRGKRKLSYEGYCYTEKNAHRFQQIVGIRSWVCEKENCPGKVKTHNDDPQQASLTEHNHAPAPELCVAKSSLTEMRKLASLTSEPTRAIRNRCTAELPLNAAVHLPSNEAVRHRIQRARKSIGLAIPNPNSVAEIDIPRHLTLSTRGRNLIIHDSGVGDDKRLLVLGTAKNLRLLAGCPHWFCDGTFKVSPSKQHLL